MMRPSFLLLSVVVLSSLSLAEDGERGRLPDGRAYRTGDDGTQLIDYIAELELSVSDLTRQVQGLETEIEQQRSTCAAAQPVVERPVSKVATCPAVEPCRCDEETVPLQRQLKEAQARTAELQKVVATTSERYEERLRGLERAWVCPSIDCRTERASELARLAMTEASLAELTSRLEAQQSESASLREASVRRERELERSLRSELADRIQEIARITEERDEVREQLAAMVEDRDAARTRLAAFEKQQRSQPVVASQARASMATTTQARSRAVETVRTSVTNEVRSLRGLITERDQKFESYQARAPRLAVAPTVITSSRGRDVATLDKEVREADSIYTLTLARKDINEMRQKVREDLQLIDRLTKAKR